MTFAKNSFKKSDAVFSAEQEKTLVDRTLNRLQAQGFRYQTSRQQPDGENRYFLVKQETAEAAIVAFDRPRDAKTGEKPPAALYKGPWDGTPPELMTPLALNVFLAQDPSLQRQPANRA